MSAPRTTLTPDLELAQASLVARQRSHGVTLPVEDANAVAEDLLAEALHLALTWLEGGPMSASSA